MLENLEEFGMDGDELSLPFLVQLFEDLSSHYKFDPWEVDVVIYDLTYGDIKPIFKHLAELDGTYGSPFETTLDSDNVVI